MDYEKDKSFYYLYLLMKLCLSRLKVFETDVFTNNIKNFKVIKTFINLSNTFIFVSYHYFYIGIYGYNTFI